MPGLPETEMSRSVPEPRAVALLVRDATMSLLQNGAQKWLLNKSYLAPRPRILFQGCHVSAASASSRQSPIQIAVPRQNEMISPSQPSNREMYVRPVLSTKRRIRVRSIVRFMQDRTASSLRIAAFQNLAATLHLRLCCLSEDEL